jgi:CPA1 family monovalent cation:H+ antiporter
VLHDARARALAAGVARGTVTAAQPASSNAGFCAPDTSPLWNRHPESRLTRWRDAGGAYVAADAGAGATVSPLATSAVPSSQASVTRRRARGRTMAASGGIVWASPTRDDRPRRPMIPWASHRCQSTRFVLCEDPAPTWERGRRPAGTVDSGAPGRLVGTGFVITGFVIVVEAGVRSLAIVLALVGLATVVAEFARRARVPAPSLLVVAGLAVGLVPGAPVIRVSPDVVSLIVLPPLLYAAGEELSWRDLRRVWRPVTVLAVGLVVVSAAAVAGVAAVTVGLPLSLAFLLGAVLSSTDPVAVTALGRRLALPSRLQTLVQAESLFNDATSLILFRATAAFVVAGGGLSAGDLTAQFLLLAGGGAIAGCAVAVLVTVVRRRTEDPVVETVVSLVTPYLAYAVAEAVHASGVGAVVVASVILGVRAPRLTGAQTRLQMAAVHATVVFVLESVVFALIGLQLPSLIRRLSEADQRWFLPALAIAATLMVVRVAWVFPMAAVRHWRRLDVGRPLWQIPAVISWAGARGVVPLAAALAIPFVDATGQPLEDRDLVQVLATAVIVISLVVQGFTLAPLVRRAGLSVPVAESADEYARARLELAEAGLAYVEELDGLDTVAPVVLEQVRRSLRTRIEVAREDDADPAAVGRTYRGLRRDVIAVQGRELARMYAEGTIGEETRRRLQRQLDLEDARFSDEH